MPDTMIVRHCAPTLAGLKTASMFTSPFPSREEMTPPLTRLHPPPPPQGIRVPPLRFRGRVGLTFLSPPRGLIPP